MIVLLGAILALQVRLCCHWGLLLFILFLLQAGEEYVRRLEAQELAKLSTPVETTKGKGKSKGATEAADESKKDK